MGIMENRVETTVVLTLTYYNKGTPLFTTCPYYDDLFPKPLVPPQQPGFCGLLRPEMYDSTGMPSNFSWLRKDYSDVHW